MCDTPPTRESAEGAIVCDTSPPARRAGTLVYIYITFHYWQVTFCWVKEANKTTDLLAHFFHNISLYWITKLFITFSLLVLTFHTNKHVCLNTCLWHWYHTQNFDLEIKLNTPPQPFLVTCSATARFTLS